MIRTLTINKYLAKELIKIIFNISLIFFCLGIIMNLFEEINFFKDIDANIYLPITLSLLYVPSLLYNMFPFIIFLSGIWFFLKIKKTDELTAINVSGTNTINAVLETASEINSPVIIQFSKGGAQFIAGNGIDNSNLNASIAGAISGAHHIHNVCDNYKTEVIIHTDHCSRKILPWIDGLLDYGHDFYNKNGYPLFSSHMIDLSDEPIEENIIIDKKIIKNLFLNSRRCSIKVICIS